MVQGNFFYDEVAELCPATNYCVQLGDAVFRPTTVRRPALMIRGPMASEAMIFSAMHFFRMCCRSLVVLGCIALLASATETNRLAYLHGPGPVSIATNQIDRVDPELQSWIQQGLGIEVHTMDHPGPLSKDSEFTEVKSNCDRLAF